MDYNYHTHTARCGHASGQDEEYILRAIACGVREMGFSDHMPLSFADGHESYFRVPIAQAEDYTRSLTQLREKYRDRIAIHIGFEMEYYPSRFEEMVALARGYGAEYLICGQHYIGEEWPQGTYVAFENDDAAQLEEYTDCVVAAIRSGVFTYIAHPDLFHYRSDADLYARQARRICEASLAHNVPLEVNLLGLRARRHYPYDPFWAVAGQVGCPVTFGFDAHTPQDAYDAGGLVAARELVARHQLNYIGRPRLISL